MVNFDYMAVSGAHGVAEIVSTENVGRWKVARNKCLKRFKPSPLRQIKRANRLQTEIC